MRIKLLMMLLIFFGANAFADDTNLMEEWDGNGTGNSTDNPSDFGWSKTSDELNFATVGGG